MPSDGDGKVLGLMEALQLFRLDPAAAERSVGRRRLADASGLNEAAWHEMELFLADHLEREGDLAMIQVALTLCDLAGKRDIVTLEELNADVGLFPRSAHAIARVMNLLELPAAERPEGFWPRFLLEQFQDAGAR